MSATEPAQGEWVLVRRDWVEGATRVLEVLATTSPPSHVVQQLARDALVPPSTISRENEEGVRDAV